MQTRDAADVSIDTQEKCHTVGGASPMKKLLTIMLAVAMALVATGCAKPPEIGGLSSPSAAESPADPATSIVWEEAKPLGGETGFGRAGALYLPFDRSEILQRTDFVFKGKILSHQDYDVSWTDATGKEHGPFAKSILQVQVLETYLGRPSNNKDVLRIYYPEPIDSPFNADDPFRLLDGSEYVFFARSFGEEYLQEDLIGTPYHKTEIEKRADMVVGNAPYFTLVTGNGMVVANTDYDFANQSISLTEPGSAAGLVPPTFSYLAGQNCSYPYSMFQEDYFVAALRHFASV
jgi:hypothetical protein